MSESFRFTRVLALTSPHMRGEDVTAAQDHLARNKFETHFLAEADALLVARAASESNHASIHEAATAMASYLMRANAEAPSADELAAHRNLVRRHEEAGRLINTKARGICLGALNDLQRIDDEAQRWRDETSRIVSLTGLSVQTVCWPVSSFARPLGHAQDGLARLADALSQD